jgi:large subunit ribosomal protein L15
MNLSSLKPPKGQVKKGRRVGQGMGTGRGKYSGRGAKGARSISGYSKMRGFEGGQMPLHRRLPKRGFTNIFKKDYAILNIGRLEKLEGDTFTPESLKASGVVKKLGDGLKILAGGELKRAVHVSAHLFSEDAEKKIVAAGGTVTKLELKVSAPKPRGTGKQTVARKEAAARPVRAKKA